MHPSLAVHGALARGAFAVAVLVSLAVLFAPAAEVPPSAPGVDKLVHGALFLALALTGRWAGIRGPVLATTLVVYAAVSEPVQGLIGRDASVWDWVADVAGVLLGLVVWEWSARRSRRAPDRLA